MMMKSSMNFPVFSLLLLTAHLCLWITPAFSVTISQVPVPAVVGQDVSLQITGFDPATAAKFLVCSWYFGSVVDEAKLISVFDKTTKTDKQTKISIDDKCGLKITTLTQEQIMTYTFLANYGDKVETKTYGVNGAERFGMPSIVFLSFAALISSLTLF